jgi:hypothetical protein
MGRSFVVLQQAKSHWFGQLENDYGQQILGYLSRAHRVIHGTERPLQSRRRLVSSGKAR